MWAQSTELKGAAGSGEGGKDRARGVFPTGQRGRIMALGRAGSGNVMGVKAGSGCAGR